MSERDRQLVLVVDDDPDLVRFVEVSLRFEGFDTASATDGPTALEAAVELMPDLVLLDVSLTGLDGFEVCRRLRADLRTQHMSIIMLTGKTLTADRIVGLTAGADDYIIKPFDPMELAARVKSTLGRADELRAANPLTRLPGNPRIRSELMDRISSGVPFAVLYIDLDNFKAYNDYYGFLRGDGAIKRLASCVVEAARALGGKSPFVGHIGGDDFVAIVETDGAEASAKEIVSCWDARLGELYEPEDLERGFIEVTDRRLRKQRFPLSRVSIGIASNAHRAISSHWEVSEIATEMKQFAKRNDGSSYALDRRHGGAIVLDEEVDAEHLE